MDESSLTTALYMKSKFDCIQAVQKWDKKVKILKECIVLYNFINTCNSDQISVKGTSATFKFPSDTIPYCLRESHGNEVDEWNKHFKEFGFRIGGVNRFGIEIILVCLDEGNPYTSVKIRNPSVK
jgi:hypothetical protein